MTLPIYLAMTAAEMHTCASLPTHCAYMACHFSPYGTGLTDLPEALPADSILIINDRIPVSKHDPGQILEQLQDLLERISISGILLDLQRKDNRQTEAIVCALTENISLPVCVCESYACSPQSPVFVTVPAPHIPLTEHLGHRKDRQIWLDVAPTAYRYRVDRSGCTQEEIPVTIEPLPFQDNQLHCHYRIQTTPDSVLFTLQRTKEDLLALLDEARDLGVTKAMGLYQEWQDLFP